MIQKSNIHKSKSIDKLKNVQLNVGLKF